MHDKEINDLTPGGADRGPGGGRGARHGDIRLTGPQRRAVEVRGRPVLVSAAAGSGKTRVLTERLMARVLEGENIDRFLVITFTRAAAAELRGRILSELNALAAASPGQKRLREQSALLYRAKIGTIDSFCTDLVRENAHLLQISPSFSILDEDRAENLRARALEDVLDRAYERIDQDRDLRTLVDSVGAGRDDQNLAKLVLSLHRQMQSHAFPDQWAAQALDMLDVSGCADAGRTVWGAYLLADAAAEADYHARALERAVEIMALPGSEKMMAAYGPAYSELALQFRDMARASETGWDAARSVLDRPAPKLGRLVKFPDTALKDRVYKVWKAGGEGIKRLRRALDGSSAALLADIAASRGPLTALVGLVRELEQAFSERKRRANGCDFADMEHMCIELLCEPDGGPTALAKTVSGRFAEVMVDEYQDVNGVQETLFRRVSDEGRNLFAVGDVKQSIYRFRLAEPSIFIDRYERFAGGREGERILLRENFRSRRSVLDACNAVFSRIMSRALGDVEYNDEARLVCGREDADGEAVKPELCLIDSAALQDEDMPDKTMLEARYVAGRIRSMVEAGEPISDGKGGTRPVRYGDIALLLRTPKSTGAAYSQALVEAGVPVTARQGGAFFAQPEVRFAISMLAVADNPRQDVPLIAALRGLPFGFTPDELAAIRAAGKGELWDALCLRAETDERCGRFVALARQLRSLSREESTDGVLRRLYDSTDLLTICGVMADAPRRIADLMQLYEYARQFESGGGRGLFRFVAWLRDMERRGMEPPAPAGGDAVQLMSIHKSKGLEWPVVFLADNGHGWSRGGGEHVLCHRRLGLGMRLTDPARGVYWPTLPWLAIDRAAANEELSEQERVLYVAMTRARERLIMTCTVKDPASALAAWGGPSGEPVEPRQLLRAGSAAPWLLAAAAGDGGESISVRIVDQTRTAAAEEAPAAVRPAADPALVQTIAQRLDWRYPHAGAVALPSKLTATAVKDLAPDAVDAEASELPGSDRVRAPLRRPDFGRASRPLTGPERGVAAHLVMQYIDFQKTDSAAAVAGEIARLERMGLMDARQAAAVDPEDILAFFRSPLGRRLLAADRVVREFRFSLLCPAAMWYPEAGEESVLLQGVVDCCMEERGELTVIDFKTDGRMEPERYAGQLQAYAAAMERIFQKPVRQAALWYLRLKKEALCPLGPMQT